MSSVLGPSYGQTHLKVNSVAVDSDSDAGSPRHDSEDGTASSWGGSNVERQELEAFENIQNECESTRMATI
eukprot:483783-Rhodomonas_salina.1